MEYRLARVAAIYEPRGDLSYVCPRRLDFDAGFQPALVDQVYEAGESCGGRSGYDLVEEDKPVELCPAGEIEFSRVEGHLRPAGDPERNAGALGSERREHV